MNSKPTKIKTGIYQHFKGGRYRVIGVGKHSETLEDLVFYEPLYENKLAKLWVRPVELFNDEKEVDGTRVPRFQYVGPEG